MKKPPSNAENAAQFSVNELDSLLLSKRNEEIHIQPDVSQSQAIQPSSLGSSAQRIDYASKQMEEVFNHVEKTGVIPISQIRYEILPVIQQAAEIPHIYHLFYELRSKDEYTYRHTICVGIISTMIGKWVGLGPADLSELALGATLHDIGKTKITRSILNKPGKLTFEEYEEIKKHTIYGYEILKGTPEIDLGISLIALQHHEREDGRGYPLGLKGNKISNSAKIVAIADVFHAMSSSRVYHKAEPYHHVIKQMQNDVFGKFDPKIMLVFLYNMMSSLVGQNVLLSNGAVGSIILIDPYEPLRVLVKTKNKIIDLKKERQVEISRILEGTI